jgi:endonuclease/exonuclease/phosphatase family metal-dependent hydrolase
MSNLGSELPSRSAHEHHVFEHPAHLRVLTLNFWGIEPVLEQRLKLAEAQLRELHPDVICLQEVRPLNGRDGLTTAHHLAEALGYQCVYEPSLEWHDDDFYPGHAGGQEGLAILARHAIHEHRVQRLPEARPTEKRILLSARVDTAAEPIWVHTTHLHYRLDDGLAREKQVVAISEAMETTKGESEPGAVQILCGDFNASPEHDEIRYLRGLTTLAGRRVHMQDAFARMHSNTAPEAGITWSSENPLTRPLRSLDIDRRIDYIFVSSRQKDGRGTVLDARVVMDRRDPDGSCASDHYGVLADVQVSENPPAHG